MRSCDYSPLMLAGTVAGMALTYLAPPLWRCSRSGCAQIVRHRRLGADGALVPADPAVLPPLAACGVWRCPLSLSLYMLFTLDSAYQYAAGKGGNWKGRVQAKGSQ